MPRVAITVVIAALSYRFLEQPIRREGFRPWLRRVTARPRAPGHAATGGRARRGRPRRRRRLRVRPLAGRGIGGAVPGLRAPASDQHPRTPIKAVTPAKPPPVTHQAGPAPKPLNRLHVTAIGDSVLESAAPAMRLVFPFLTVDADVGRQANQVFDEIAWLQLGNRLGQIVVIAAGSNGIVSGDELDRLLTKLSSRRRVVLVNVHAPRVWQDLNNSMFVSVAKKHPNTVVADWHSAAREHPEWLYPDGTHVRPEWAYQYAAIVQRAAFGPAPTHGSDGARASRSRG